jgi:hypothetical protein
VHSRETPHTRQLGASSSPDQSWIFPASYPTTTLAPIATMEDFNSTCSMIRRRTSARRSSSSFAVAASCRRGQSRRGRSRRISPSCRSCCGSKSLYFPEASIRVVDYDASAVAVKACIKAIKPDVHAGLLPCKLTAEPHFAGHKSLL